MRCFLLCLVGLSSCATLVRGTYPGDRVMWDDIVSHAEPLTLAATPVAVVAPHHLIDATELSGFWQALARPRPSTVVVLAPDHYARGEGVTVARRVRYETVYGPLDSTWPLVGATNDAAFVGEHAVHVHAPFIRRFLPDARFTAVLLQWATPREDLEALAQQLHATLPADALVVASVDFSHYQPEPWATFHDEASFASITTFDLDHLFLREVDSPESLFVAMRFAQLRGALTATRVLHTNSQRRREQFVHDSTSHQYFTFTQGPLAPRPSVSVAISPDVEGLTLHEGWTWHPTRDTGAPKAAVLEQLRGQEDRFFMGPDAVLFNLAPGARVERTVHGLRVVYVGVDLAAPTPSLEGDCVIALAFRGSLSLEDATTRARALKATVVVGRGFGDEQPLEFDGQHLFAPSLGQLGRTHAQMLGVTCTPDGLRVRSVPVLPTATLDLDAIADTLERPRTTTAP